VLPKENVGFDDIAFDAEVSVEAGVLPKLKGAFEVDAAPPLSLLSPPSRLRFCVGSVTVSAGILDPGGGGAVPAVPLVGGAPNENGAGAGAGVPDVLSAAVEVAAPKENFAMSPLSDDEAVFVADVELPPKENGGLVLFVLAAAGPPKENPVSSSDFFSSSFATGEGAEAAPNEKPPELAGLGSSFLSGNDDGALKENPPVGFFSSICAAGAGGAGVTDDEVAKEKPPGADFLWSSSGDAAEVAPKVKPPVLAGPLSVVEADVD
jgi:hypothetical protein